MRINQYIASTGYCSRRKADALIASGHVKLNGRLAHLGDKVGESDKRSSVGSKSPINKDLVADIVEVKTKTGTWKTLHLNLQKITYLVYKPKGYVCTAKPQRGEPSVLDLVPKTPRVFPVGRLDKDTEGLIYLTNDGAFAQEMSHPAKEIEKTYYALCRMPSRYTENAVEGQLGRLRKGFSLDGRRITPKAIKLLSVRGNTCEVEVIITQGVNRQVRRMMGKINLQVLKLIRTGIGNTHTTPGVAWRTVTVQIEGV